MNLDLSSITGYEEEIRTADSVDALYDVKVKYLGKKGMISALSKQMKDVPAEDRPAFGQKINEVRTAFETAHDARLVELKQSEMNQKLASESIDVSMPGFPLPVGSLHPITRTYHDIVDIFVSMGYSVEVGPEVDTDFYNFEALNMPKEHPARDMQDTFYIDPETVLRTHTSPVQVRTMETHKPPIKIIAPGKVYRSDYDVTHTPMFHQVEGLVVDERITFADLKGTLGAFTKKLFGDDVSIRLRPSFFPFTEPSAEVDVSCVHCKGEGCRVCKSTGWLEIMGCGMVNPAVFDAVGLDSEKYTGFAFGMGIERIAMLRYGVNDLRAFFENNLKFLQQF